MVKRNVTVGREKKEKGGRKGGDLGLRKAGVLKIWKYKWLGKKNIFEESFVTEKSPLWKHWVCNLMSILQYTYLLIQFIYLAYKTAWLSSGKWLKHRQKAN